MRFVLEIIGGLITIVGKGHLNLRDMTIHLKLAPRPKNASLLSLAVPINVRGTLSKPSTLPDAAGVVKGVAGPLLGSVINPLGLLVLPVSGGSDDENPRLGTLARKPAPAARQSKSQPVQQTEPQPQPVVAEPTKAEAEEKKEKPPLSAVGKTMETLAKGITKGFEGLFGK